MTRLRIGNKGEENSNIDIEEEEENRYKILRMGRFRK